MSTVAGPDIIAIHARTNEELCITNVQREDFYGGGSVHKTFVTGQVAVAGGGVEGIALVERSNMLDFAENCLALGDVGVPVPSDVYVYGSRVLVPDVKADGSELYGQALLTCLTFPDQGHGTFRRRPNIDPLFLEATENSGLQVLGDRALAIAEGTTASGITLPGGDTFELRVRPNGEASLIFLDLDTPDLERADAARNIQRALKFVANTRRLRAFLLDPR